jgi:hypothetical protein
MTMKMNSLMLDRLSNLNDLIQLLILDENLRHLLDSQIIEVENCFFLEVLWKKSPAVSLSLFPDRTGFECFINHIHIEDYLDSSNSTNLTSDLQLTNGFKFATKLKEKLAEYRPEVRFRVIIASDDETCTVRFHKIRNNEHWLSDDLEEYQEEAICVMDTDDLTLPKN